VKLLVLNCHEAWVHQLSVLDADLEIVVGLPGRYTREWDTRMRPLPGNARVIRLEQAAHEGYDAVIAHNITDLLDTRHIRSPKLLVFHDTLEGRIAQQGAESDVDTRDMRAQISTYLSAIGGHAIAVSRSKAKSWGVTHTVVQNCADPHGYPDHIGDVAAGLRVANHVVSKRVFLAWEFHEQAFADLPLRLVGHNPELGVEAAEHWDHLKALMASHRFLVHTADPRYEDGFNMAVLEGMAAGLPVLTNRNPTGIIRHGVTGFVADTPTEMREFALQLLGDKDLANRMGQCAREDIRHHFSPVHFRRGMDSAIRDAKKKWLRTMRRTRTAVG
jgi:hypothetical protein